MDDYSGMGHHDSMVEEKKKVDADLIQQLIQQRNENFELKQKNDTLNNFREISQIEYRKLRNDLEKTTKEKNELADVIRGQREEILKLKKISEKINTEDMFSKLDDPQ